MVPWNSDSGGFAYIWQSEKGGIIAIETEGTQIHFLSDVLVTVASLNLKVPNNWMEQIPKRDCHKPISILGFILSGAPNDDVLLNTLKTL